MVENNYNGINRLQQFVIGYSRLKLLYDLQPTRYLLYHNILTVTLHVTLPGGRFQSVCHVIQLGRSWVMWELKRNAITVNTGVHICAILAPNFVAIMCTHLSHVGTQLRSYLPQHGEKPNYAVICQAILGRYNQHNKMLMRWKGFTSNYEICVNKISWMSDELTV